jgi:DHA1 family bicyclomycin/chloramphenicol resistance-like MFS transporter
MILRPNTGAMTATLALMTALGPLSTDMYLPSLPDIALRLGASVSRAQLTLSIFLFGFAVGQIIYGPFADRFGRKPVLLAGFALYGIGSLACAVSPSIGWLIAARLVQALGGAGPIIIARAIVRDLYEGPRAARELSMMGAIMSITPTFAPTIGGFLHATMGWRSNFILSFLIVGALCVFVARAMPETIRRRRAEPISLGSILHAFRVVGATTYFRVQVSMLALIYAGLFAYVSASSFVLQGVYHLTPVQFGLAFGAGAAAGACGMRLGNVLVARIGVPRSVAVGLTLCAIGGVAQLGLMLAFPQQSLALIGPLMVYVAGIGVAVPTLMASLMAPFPERAGAASSLAGFVQMSSAALAGVLIGLALGSSAFPVPIAMCSMGVSALLLWALTRHTRRRSP